MIDQGDGDREQKQQQRENLRQVITFCENKIDCRRAQVLGYFGEVFDKSQCHRTCDNCERNTEVTMVDRTSYALKALKLANEIDDRFTLNGLLDAFRGSGAKKALKFQDCDNFGSGRDLSKSDAERLLQAMVTNQVLRSYNQTNPSGFTTSYIKLGPKWKDLETGKMKITLTSAEEDGGGVKKTNKAKSTVTSTLGNKRKGAVIDSESENSVGFVDDYIGGDEYEHDSFISDDSYESESDFCEEEISKTLSSPVYNSSTLNKTKVNDHYTSISKLAPEYQTILHREDPTAIMKTRASIGVGQSTVTSTSTRPVNTSISTNARPLNNSVPTVASTKASNSTYTFRDTVSPPVPSSGICYDYLIHWRDRIAQEKKLNAAFVLSNGILGQIARQLPMDEDELGRIPGMTHEKVSKYGSDILSITNRYIL